MKTAFAEAFSDRSVFVTGHTGFKGSWLCLWLSQLGARITGYALDPPTQPNHFSIARIPALLAGHYAADVRDIAVLEQAVRDCEPDIIFHLAAQSVVRRGYRIPRETFETNFMGVVNILEVVRRLGRPCTVVVITSDKCYENREQVWGYRECDPLGESDPYGASKGAAELAVRSYRQSYFLPRRFKEHGVKLASARAGNVIGGGDWTEDALVVDVMRALHAGEPVRVRSPQALRPWQHVLQALSGYLTLAARMDQSDDPRWCSGWNFGPLPGNELPVAEVVEFLIQQWGHGTWVDASDPTQPHESTVLRLAIDKALWQLGWRPGWSIYETLRRTADWYRAYFAREDSLQQFGLSQIDDYQEEMQQTRDRSIADPVAPLHS